MCKLVLTSINVIIGIKFIKCDNWWGFNNYKNEWEKSHNVSKKNLEMAKNYIKWLNSLLNIYIYMYQPSKYKWQIEETDLYLYISI